MFKKALKRIYNSIPYEIRLRPFDFFVPIFLIVLILAHWFKWLPPSSFFFQDAKYEWLVILCEIDLLIGSIIVMISMAINSFDHRCVSKVGKLEIIGWWTIFVGSLSLSISAIVFTPGQNVGWPTLIWSVNALAALIKVMSPLEDKIKWIR